MAAAFARGVNEEERNRIILLQLERLSTRLANAEAAREAFEQRVIREFGEISTRLEGLRQTARNDERPGRRTHTYSEITETIMVEAAERALEQHRAKEALATVAKMRGWRDHVGLAMVTAFCVIVGGLFVWAIVAQAVRVHPSLVESAKP